MKNSRLIALASIVTCLSTELFAGANVQLVAKDVSKVTYFDRASSHPEYVELLIRGSISQTDAAVDGLPSPLPQTIRLLVKKAESESLLNTCKDIALTAKTSKGVFIAEIFLNNPDNLVKMIEGGMAESQFNAFVIRADDLGLQSVGCSLGQ